jgi:uncharacterized protein
MSAPAADGTRRQAGWPVVVGALVAWVAAGLVAAFVVYLLAGSEGDPLLEPGGTLVHDAVPALAAFAVMAGIVSWLRWWPVVLRDDVPARTWAWVFPLGLAAGGAAVADWSRIGAAGGALVAALVVSVLAVAASEELAFRGFLLRAMRDRYPELAAALITTFVFGIAHMLNGGFGNLAQGLLTFMSGFVFYATRRVSGGLLVPVALHTWWDFCILSADLGAGVSATSSLFTGAVILLALFLLALAGYRLWQPRPAHPA